jgi:hypothetical protein
MSPKHFPTLSIIAASLAAVAAAGCGGEKQASTATSPAAQAPAATAPAATTPAATAAAPATTTTKHAATTTTATTPAAKVPALRPAAASDPVVVAAAATNRQSGALAFAMKGTVTTNGQPVPLAVRGTFDRRSRRGVYTARMKLGSQAFTVRQILDGQELYLRSPLFAGKLPGGKSWLRINLAEAARTPGVDLDALGASGPSQDPTQALDYLQGAGTATRLETAKVAGVTTTHYLVQVDLRRAAKRNSSAPAKRSIKRLIKTLGPLRSLPIDVWVDGDRLVRRQRVRYSATVAGVRSNFDVTTDYTAFGKTVDATPPATADTFDGLSALKAAAKARKEAQQGSQG